MKITKECEICKINNDNKTYSFVIIDTDSNNITCGIKGILNGENIRIKNNEVTCSKCNSLLYKEN
jgi:hypothetical protein